MSDVSAPDPGRWSPARNLARAAFTVPPFLVQHLVRRRRVDSTTSTVESLSEPRPQLSRGTERSLDGAVQTATEGVGPLVMRTYAVTITDATVSGPELMDQLIASPGEFNDDRIAGFVIEDRPAVGLERGDELVVELPGPWNGPVRVITADRTQLLLQTLEGHMEAGQIRFDVIDANVGPAGRHEYTFRIRSWARGGDAAFTLLHLGLRVAKELQTAMWVAMCEGAVQVAGGRRIGSISVTTEMLADSSPDDRDRDVSNRAGGH